MLNWQIEQIKLELKYTWKISRNSSDFKFNSIISVGSSIYKGIGEVAPNIRYNETPEIILSEFNRFVKAGASNINDYQELTDLLTELKLPNALCFGIESAYTHYLCNIEKTSIYNLLGIQKSQKVETSFSLPIMDVSEVKNFYFENNLQRFARLKTKVNAENAIELVNEISKISNQPLIVDGNEAWKNPDDILSFMHSASNANIALIEQPMHASMVDEYKYLKPKSKHDLFADESICAHANFDELKQQFHGINMKLMKAGGYLNGLNLLNEAKQHGMKTMIGCMIETTLGISSAYFLCNEINVIDLDGFMIIKNEPFNLLREHEGQIMA